MEPEEIRLRSLLSLRTGDMKYANTIPYHLQFAGLYPEILGQDDTEALNKLKLKLDKELK